MEPSKKQVIDWEPAHIRHHTPGWIAPLMDENHEWHRQRAQYYLIDLMNLLTDEQMQDVFSYIPLDATWKEISEKLERVWTEEMRILREKCLEQDHSKAQSDEENLRQGLYQF